MTALLSAEDGSTKFCLQGKIAFIMRALLSAEDSYTVYQVLLSTEDRLIMVALLSAEDSSTKLFCYLRKIALL